MMEKRMDSLSKGLDNKVVAITGTGSGIGRELAVQLAARGARLSISDINEQALEKTKMLCEQRGAKDVMTRVFDVSQRDAVYAWADATVEHFKEVHMIINNAGVSVNVGAENADYADFEWLMGINFWGMVYGTKAFLPYLKQSSVGRIVNISSLFGLAGAPNMSLYNASKYAIRGFSECLSIELQLERSSVDVTVVHPGGIKTNIVNNARFGQQVGDNRSHNEFAKWFNSKLAATSAESAAEQIIIGIIKNKRRVMVGSDAKWLDLVQRIFPARYQKLVVFSMRKVQERLNVRNDRVTNNGI